MRAAIVLAAGLSRRFGRGEKLLARLGDASVLAQALAQARASARRVIVVVPSRGGRVGRAIGPARAGVQPVVARRRREGLGASLAAGLAALRPIEREVLVFLGDMPFAAAPRALRLRGGEVAVRPAVYGRPGHPLLVRSAAARAAAAGAAGLAGRLGRVRSVPGTLAHLVDLDTPSALAAARRGGSTAPRLRCRRS